jgi:uncharacterized protein YbbC (DUF1343 family)
MPIMVKTGLQTLVEEAHSLTGSRRVGLVTQTAAVLPDLTNSVDALLRAGVNLCALYGPEHGLSGAAMDGASVGNVVDPASGLPVYSLYGDVQEPTPAMLAGVDLLVFDMQDVGVRFYTYLSTLFYVLRGAARAGLPVLVLDRPNPITGVRLEGPVVEAGFDSFIGILPGLPIRHAMTFGELAGWMAATAGIDADVRIVELQGWRRAMWFDQTGLPWVPTSPAMPHLHTATLYPGMCFLEGTNLSEGRGTSLPFEIAGAPWIDARALAGRMNALDLPGVRFRAVEFQPAASKFAGEACRGVQVHVMDREDFQPVRTALHLIVEARRLHPQAFAFRAPVRPGSRPHFDLELGTDLVRLAIERGQTVDGIMAGWEAQQAAFWSSALPFLRYTP